MEDEIDSDTKSKPQRHGQAWREEEERRLYDAFVAGQSVADIAADHDRTRGGIRSHLKIMGLIDEDGATIEPTPDYAPTVAAQKRTAKAVEKPTRRAPAIEDDQKPLDSNPQFAYALSLLMETDRSVFITGKAGTGKSTLLRQFRKLAQKSADPKNVVVLAPTGIAALNVGGQTIHHFFRFSIDITPQKVATRKKIRNGTLYKKIDTIVIDEISMVRADILDCVEAFLRMHGPHPGQKFGGVQMVFIGDLYQLPPVVGAQEREIFSTHYETPYFFSAQAMRDFVMEKVELEKVYRQKDGAFVELLNRVRDDRVDDADLAVLNNRLVIGDTAQQGKDYSICLTATNARADEINRARLDALHGQIFEASAEITGEFGREYYPAAPDLSFKVGAQVMMLNNDKEGRWVNGSLGVVEEVRTDIDDKEYIVVRLQGEDAPVAVFAHTWEVYRYALDAGQIQSESVGTFAQYPFRLAWAVTIHKSQGKTFERVTIDIGNGAFAAGQIYVALSRCTTLEGIALKTPIKRRHIMTDARIHAFLGNSETDMTGEAAEEESQPQLPGTQERGAFVELIARAILEKAPLEILYLKGNAEMTRRVIHPRAMAMETHQDRQFLGIRAFCSTNCEELLFSLDRILSVQRTK